MSKFVTSFHIITKTGRVLNATRVVMLTNRAFLS